jgi:CRP-like cAMP-binding protein
MRIYHSDLNALDRRSLAKHVTLVSHPAGTEIVSAGSDVVNFFIVISGKVEVIYDSEFHFQFVNSFDIVFL